MCFCCYETIDTRTEWHVRQSEFVRPWPEQAITSQNVCLSSNRVYSMGSQYFFCLFFSPEAMGLVTGCVFLVTLFLFIPIPFGNSWLKDNTFPQDEVSCCWLICFGGTFFNMPKFLPQVYRTYCRSLIHMLHDFAGLCRWCAQSSMETQTSIADNCQSTAINGLLR